MTQEKKSEPDIIKDQVLLRAKHLHQFIRIAPKIEIMENDPMSMYISSRLIRMYDKIMVRDIEHIEYKWPRDWVQALKERFAPRWYLKRWPVLYTIKGHNIFAHYPKFDIPENKMTAIIERIGLEL